uniref:Uncharacterized protein n=1 Tax=Romanomermis culicivorax TaxID=13658 RepID=A0A915HVS5_ROMCU
MTTSLTSVQGVICWPRSSGQWCPVDEITIGQNQMDKIVHKGNYFGKVVFDCRGMNCRHRITASIYPSGSSSLPISSSALNSTTAVDLSSYPNSSSTGSTSSRMVITLTSPYPISENSSTSPYTTLSSSTAYYNSSAGNLSSPTTSKLTSLK